jgi:hypothetical protein
MKSFQNFITEMDTGLRGELEKSGVGSASFNPKQEEAIAAVTNMIMIVANEMPTRLISFFKTLSSNNEQMKSILEKFEEDHLVNALHSAAVMAAKKLKPEDDMIATSPDDAMRHGV